MKYWCTMATLRCWLTSRDIWGQRRPQTLTLTALFHTHKNRKEWEIIVVNSHVSVLPVHHYQLVVCIFYLDDLGGSHFNVRCKLRQGLENC